PLNGFQIVSPGTPVPALTQDICTDLVAGGPGGGRGGSMQSPMAATERAGLVKRTNWNSALAAFNGTINNPVDESGNVLTGATITWAAGDTWNNQNANDTPGDFRMMKGFVDSNGAGAQSVFTVSGLPAKYLQY